MNILKLRKGSIFLTLFASLLLTAPLRSANNNTEYQTLPLYLDGSMQIYDFAKVEKNKAWTDSLKPVYLSYVARHGSRSLTSAKKVGKITKAIEEADKQGQLTPHGERYRNYLQSLLKACKGDWGLLSAVGNTEASCLGIEMYQLMPSLFKKGKAFAECTSVPRSIMTMFQYMHSLERFDEKLEIFTASGIQNSRLLHAFTADTAYSNYRKKGEWEPVYEDFIARHIPLRPVESLFKKGYIKDKKSLRELTIEMYFSMQVQRAMGRPAPTTEWMTLDEYRECWKATNLDHYLRNTVNPVSTLAAEATRPLIEVIITDADKALKKSSTKMNGYFAHAETLLPLLSTIGIPGCFIDNPDYDNLEKQWQVNDITPLASNFAIIFLRSNSGEIYVSTRLNGRNIAPIPQLTEIVTWKELKEYWQHRVRSFINQ